MTDGVELLHDLKRLRGIEGEICLKNYRNGGEKKPISSRISLSEKSPFTIIYDNKGSEIIVRKSSIVWMLRNDPTKISSDRLQRVKDKDVYAIYKKKFPQVMGTYMSKRTSS